MRGLSFLTRTSAPWCWNIIGYHSPRSMTWSWVLSFNFFRADEARVWPLFGKGSLRVPWVGYFIWHTQKPMMNLEGADAAIKQAVRRTAKRAHP